MDLLFNMELDNFKIITEALLSSLYFKEIQTEVTIPPDEVDNAKSELKSMFTSCDFHVDAVVDYLSSKHYPEDKRKLFVSLFTSKKSAILYQALICNNAQHGQSLVELDWHLKLIFGTSELKNLRYPVLQLILSTVNSQSIKQIKNYDISKELLNRLINSLENIVDNNK